MTPARQPSPLPLPQWVDALWSRLEGGRPTAPLQPPADLAAAVSNWLEQRV